MNIPSGWMPIGNQDIPDTLSSLLHVDPEWIKEYLPEIFDELQERLSDIKLSDLFLNGDLKFITYYCPEVIDSLKIMYEQDYGIPSDWVCLQLNNSYSEILGQISMYPRLILSEYVPRVIKDVKRKEFEK